MHTYAQKYINAATFQKQKKHVGAGPERNTCKMYNKNMICVLNEVVMQYFWTLRRAIGMKSRDLAI